MESLRSKKAVAASLSLALALGSVPAVALADDEGQSDNSSEESQQRASYTFSANGGQFGSSDVANIEANEDGSVDAPTPTRSGYTFKGWYSTSNLDQIPESYQQYYKLDPSAPNGFTWFAAWEKSAESETPAESKAFEAQFVANGGAFADGSETLAAKADADGIVSQPATPTRDGYTFKGWYWVSSEKGMTSDQLETQKVNFSNPLKGNANFFALWEKNAEQTELNVLYVANGGTFVDGNDTMQGVADSDGMLRQPPAPTREGYTFAGWSWVSDPSQLPEDQRDNYKVDFSQSVAGKDHVTMYAQWTKNAEQNEYNVMYVANGGQFATGETFQQGVTDSDGIMRQPAAPTREGYTFDGWYWHADLSQLTEEQKQNEKVDFSQPVQSNVTIYAQWTKNEEQAETEVLYVANGGQFATGETFQQGVTDSDGIMRQPAAPTREGYTFDGWYWHADLTQLTEEQKQNDKVDFSQPVAGKDHVTMYAQWTKNAEQNEYNVMYVANGGQFATGETFQQGVTDSDGIMRQPAAPTREGYTFDGWYWHADLTQLTEEQKQNDKVDFSQPVQSNVTIYAQWTKNEEQAETEVLYVANGGQFATGETFQQGVTDSDGIMRQPAAPTREGYTFAGWYWHADLTQLTEEQKQNDKVDFSQPVAGKDHVTMYAQWTKNAEQNEYNVMYVANGGQFATGETFQQGVTDSDGIMRQPAAPTREGYTFDGWYWHADLTQLTEEQKQNDKVDFSQPVQSNVTIYAQWTKNEEQAEEITVKFVDNFNNTVTNTVIKKGETVDKPAIDPSYDGWEFEGWSSTLKDEQGNWDYTPVDFSKAVEDTDGDGVVTYYAFYNEAKADDNGNGNAATDKAATDESDAQGSDQQAADESSEAPQTGDATNAAAVAGIGGIAGLMAAAAALLRRRRNN